MDEPAWRKRANLRSDMTVRATHLTKGEDDDTAFNNLWSIVVSKQLNGGNGFVVGNDRVCCFQDVPLLAIAENLRYEKDIKVGQTRYSAFGIRVNKWMLYNKNGRPVIYGRSSDLRKVLPENEYWRIVNLNLTNSKSMVDWTHEREWRVKGDYSFEYDEIEIIVKDNEYYRKFVNRCFDEGHSEIITEVNGIIPLSSIYS